MSFLQKTPSSPVSCHATGFYPNRATLLWTKDKEELHDDTARGEILPNPDGTFQMSVDLNLSSVAPEDWKKYNCVFQLSGVKDDIVTQLGEGQIRTNWGKKGGDEGGHFEAPITLGVTDPLGGFEGLIGVCCKVLMFTVHQAQDYYMSRFESLVHVCVQSSSFSHRVTTVQIFQVLYQLSLLFLEG